MQAPSAAHGPPAQPALTYNTFSDWKTARPKLLADFEAQIYGQIPFIDYVAIDEKRILLERTFNSLGQIEEFDVRMLPSYVQDDGTLKPINQHRFKMVVITPRRAEGPVPIIMMQNFCPNRDVVGKDVVSPAVNKGMSCSGGGFMSGAMTYAFGRYIVSPPIEEILSRGYALAIVHPPDFIPDSASPALTKLAEDLPQSYAIGAWAAQFDGMAEALDADGRFSHQIAYGHSRYGKSALVAAAYSKRIHGVIAHQSGTGGASLSRNKSGETVAQITKSYPHWFSPNYQEEALTVDQHQLLALIAPEPLLLGNARRDVWSDPEGAFRAARAASDVYRLYGKDGLTQKTLTDFTPDADIAFWMRPGTHGVVKEDWPAFLAFLDAHFKEK